MKISISPKFDANQIVDETIRKDWFRFQNEAFNLGTKMLNYMQSYINSHVHRRGNTGNLANSITLESQTTAGSISWGIGNISILNNRAKYWYVINYGKKITGELFIPGGGKLIPGSFEGNVPNSSLRGGVQRFNYSDGSGFGMKPKSPVRPINYIESTRFRLNKELTSILTKLKRG